MKGSGMIQIDAYIMKCPYFGGKNTIDRRIINGEPVHVGNCSLEFHYRKVCPSSECRCAEYMELTDNPQPYKGTEHE